MVPTKLLFIEFNCLRATKQLRGDSSLLTINSVGVPGAYLTICSKIIYKIRSSVLGSACSSKYDMTMA